MNRIPQNTGVLWAISESGVLWGGGVQGMEQEKVFERLFKLIEQHHCQQTQGTFVEYHEPQELRELLQLEKKDSQEDLDQLFHWVEKYLKYAVKTGHPGYLNRMWAGANLPSMVGEMVTAISNTSACTYETAPVSTLMEQYMFQEMLNLVGFKNGVGQMTTGSSNANMIAMMAARNTHSTCTKTQGLFGQAPLCAFVNEDAHYSMDRAASILGIGTDYLIKVAIDDHGRMIPDALEQAIENAKQRGCVPFFVAATAGTTVRGAYDPIGALLDLRDRHGFWLHVDGAWGGAAVLSERLRLKYLPRLEESDSFTLDFHKMLGSSLMCNVLLFNGRSGILRKICSAGDESYIFREGDNGETRDLGTLSLQCGRKVDALKWFLDWKFYGQQGLAARVEKYYELCRYAEERILANPNLEMVVPRESFNLCFRYIPPVGSSKDEFTIALRSQLQKTERALVGTGYVKGQVVMRLLITNTNVDKDAIDRFLSNVVLSGKELCRQYEQAC
ncbi:pyridoxal phosphate-dependent decarboxylase family protein [Desulfogranum japonicum]|uniref:pyridoxal phosphate-dependent decarboxylase family protein n=1 Tax=Desulfogranum japonicum TaxID=231447 RepID=UPI001E4D6E70|nr:pyridoxal-dependent decarboxylase [Desulfogranum japonicum]